MPAVSESWRWCCMPAHGLDWPVLLVARVATIVTPETLLAWHRKIQFWTHFKWWLLPLLDG